MKENAVLFAAESKAGLPRARARFLAQAISLEEASPSRIVSMSVCVSVFLLVATVAWASVTEIREVAKTQGEVIPSGLIHEVQHLEGGIVSELRVRNGDRVEAGDTLLRLAPQAYQADLEQMLARKAALHLQGERLQAIVEHREPDFSRFGEGYLDLAKKQRTLYLAQTASHRSERRVIDSQIRRREKELARQKNLVLSLAKEAEILEKQVAIRQQVVGKGIVSQSDLLAARAQLASTQRERREAEDSVAVAESALEEAGDRRLELSARLAKEVETEAGELINELAEVEQALVRLHDRVARLEVQAPVSGIVKGLTTSSINGVVAAGEVILQIVPVDDELIVESKISTADIGHVHPGQSAEVKVSSYDSARFGSVEGAVRQISASTYLDTDGTPYYRAEIAMAQDYVGDDPGRHRILPGMTVEADIRTGKKTVLDYLMKPISRGFDSAFRER